MRIKKLQATSYKLSAGFTLIELLVVISLMSILMLTSIATFSSFSRSQSFQTGVFEVESLLNKAKSRSLNYVKPENCVTNPLQSYQVSFTLSGSSYQLEVLCGDKNYVLESRNLPSQMTFGEESVTPVVFEAGTGVVANSAQVIVNGLGNTRMISIDNVGNISVQ